MDATPPRPWPSSVTTAAVMRRALGRPSARLVACGPPLPLTDPAAITNPAGGGVYRVRGLAAERGRQFPWSAILKVLRSPAGAVVPDGTVVTREMAEDRAAFSYWAREALIAHHRVLDGLDGGLAAPRCLGITELPDDRAWLWLEDLDRDAEQSWSLGRYALAARHLGAFNGAYLAGRPPPDAPWLSRGYLRSWTDRVVAGVVRLIDNPDAWHLPLMRATFSPEDAARLRRLWEGRETLLAALDALPQTFAHLDAFRANLFARSLPDGAEQTVAIDWAWAGQAAVGEELGPFVFATIVYDGLPLEALPELERAALGGYLDGLAAAGWDGDPALATLGYRASAPLRYAHLLTADVFRLAVDDGFRAATEVRHGRPAAETAAQRAALVRSLLDRADEARRAIEARGRRRRAA